MALKPWTAMLKASENNGWGDTMMLRLLLWPFYLVWGLIVFLFGLMGALLSIVLGLVLLILGVILTMTIIGAIVGIPLIFIGLGLMLFAFF